MKDDLKDVKFDLKEVKEDFKGLHPRQTEIEKKAISLLEQLMINCGNGVLDCRESRSQLIWNSLYVLKVQYSYFVQKRFTFDSRDGACFLPGNSGVSLKKSARSLLTRTIA